jgi:hypothetical protein
MPIARVRSLVHLVTHGMSGRSGDLQYEPSTKSPVCRSVIGWGLVSANLAEQILCQN